MRYKFIKTAKWRVRRHLRVVVAMCAFVTLQRAIAASYSFTNAEGGDATVATNWQGGAIPSAVDTTASVAFTNVGSSATAVLSDGYYAWKDLIFGQGSFSGGAVSLTDGIKVSLRGASPSFSSQLWGASTHYVHGATLTIASAQTNDVALGVRNGTMKLDGTLSSGSTLHVDGNGTIDVTANQSVATLCGDCKGGRLVLEDGKALTLTGIDATKTEFAGNLVGTGTLVKQGSGYNLVFTGDNTTNHPFAGSIDVAAGTVTFSGDKTYSYAVTPSFYWSFDDHSDPGRADVGNSNLKAYTCSATWHDESNESISCAGVNGAGIRTDGTVFMGLNSNQWPQGNNAFSIFCWVKAGSSQNGILQIVGWGDNITAAGRFCRIYFDEHGRIVLGGAKTASDAILSLSAEGNYKDGRWHHVGATYDGTILKLYVDGDLAGQTSGITFDLKAGWTGLDLGVNGLGSAGRTVCEMSIDELAIYKNTTLTAEQVADCYASYRSVSETAASVATLPDPVAWYRFDDASAVGKDSSGNGYDLTGVYKNGSSCASEETKYWPTVVANSPICGGMYASGGHRWLRYGGAAGGTLPVNIPTGSNPISVSLWVYLGDSTPRLGGTVYDVTLFQLGNSSDSNCHRISVTGSKTSDNFYRFGFATARNWTRISGNDYFVTAEASPGWHHVAYASTGSSVSFYVDGRLQGTWGGGVAIAPDGVLAIGAGVGQYDADTQSQQIFKGNIDEVKIYDSALTDAQIAADYRSQLPRTECVVSPAANIVIASGATVVIDGSEQTLYSVPTGTGTIQLKHDAALMFAPSAAATLATRVNGKGTLRVVGGSEIAFDGDIGPGVSVAVSNVTIAAGSSCSFGGSLVVESGTVLKMTETLPITGKATLKPGFVVDATGLPERWCTLISAGEIDAADVDLDSIVFENSNGGKGILKIENGRLKAKLRRGFIIVFR